MQLSFTKSHSIEYRQRPTPQHPQGDPNQRALVVPGIEGSTFDQDAFLVDRRHKSEWTIFDRFRALGNSPENTLYPKPEVGTWVDTNANGKMEPEEIRSFSDRLGDANTDSVNGYATVTLDLAVYELNSRKYVAETMGILTT